MTPAAADTAQAGGARRPPALPKQPVQRLASDIEPLLNRSPKHSEGGVRLNQTAPSATHRRRAASSPAPETPGHAPGLPIRTVNMISPSRHSAPGKDQRFSEPVQSLASKSETRRQQRRKRNAPMVHQHFEAGSNAAPPTLGRPEQALRCSVSFGEAPMQTQVTDLTTSRDAQG
jgi:hypothetical protein